MKRLLLYFSLCWYSLGFSQSTIFQDSFDTYTDFIITGIGQWQTLDLDLLDTYTGGTDTPTWNNAGDPQAFQIFNPSTAGVANDTGCATDSENSNFNPRTGAKYAACWDGVPLSNGQTATANNDWLISPPINLAGTGCALSVWVKSLSDCYGFETYRIGVYVGSGTPTQGSDFTIISGGGNLSASTWATWAERTQSLAAYDGQTIRIGIQCNSSDVYMFMVDDFKVTATTLSTSDFVASQLTVYPNPANDLVTVVNKNGTVGMNAITITDINGRTVQTVRLNAEIESEINVSQLGSGLYFVNIDTNEGRATKKIIKSLN